MAASNINVVVLTGNLTRDPELRSLPSGTSVCDMRVAVNTRRKNGATGEWEDKPNYFDVKVWGAQGENCQRFLSKGRPVAVQGTARMARVGDPGRAEAPGSRYHRRVGPVPRRARRRVGWRLHRLGRQRIAQRRAGRRAGLPDRRERRRDRRRRHTVLDSEGSDGKAASRPGEARPQAREARRTEQRAAQAVPALQGQDRPGRLPRRGDAAQVHLREGQDPLAPHQRRVPPPPEPDRARRQARPRAGAAALRERGRRREHAAAAIATAIATATADAPGDPPLRRRVARRARRRRRGLEGLPAQLPDPAQARPARERGRARRGAAATGGRRARGPRGGREGDRERRAPVAHGAHDLPAGRRRRPPVRLGHEPGHRRRRPRGPRPDASTAGASSSRSRSATSAPTWSSSRSPTT